MAVEPSRVLEKEETEPVYPVVCKYIGTTLYEAVLAATPMFHSRLVEVDETVVVGFLQLLCCLIVFLSCMLDEPKCCKYETKTL